MMEIISRLSFIAVVCVCLYQQHLLTHYKNDVKVIEQTLLECLNGGFIGKAGDEAIKCEKAISVKVVLIKDI